MRTQRKRYGANRGGSITLGQATTILDMVFNDAPVVNIHGVNISVGVAPVDPEEVMRGRIYVAALSRSVAEDSTVRNTWADQLDSEVDATTALDGSSLIWGSVSFVASDATPFNWTFAPKTSRNMQNESRLIIYVVADTISGLLDEWEAVAGISLFASS